MGLHKPFLRYKPEYEAVHAISCAVGRTSAMDVIVSHMGDVEAQSGFDEIVVAEC